MALTEAAAKACGIYVCNLWGGKLRDKVPVYASFQSYSESEDWQKHSLKGIAHAASQGFDKIKVKIGRKPASCDGEWDAIDNPFSSLLPLSILNRSVTLPDGLGIGLEPDLDKLTRYRWDGSRYS